MFADTAAAWPKRLVLGELCIFYELPLLFELLRREFGWRMEGVDSCCIEKWMCYRCPDG